MQQNISPNWVFNVMSLDQWPRIIKCEPHVSHESNKVKMKMFMASKDFITARIRSMGRVMLSLASVFSGGSALP